MGSAPLFLGRSLAGAPLSAPVRICLDTKRSISPIAIATCLFGSFLEHLGRAFTKASTILARSFGYTQDEAHFLYLVATHTGYFSTRQYLQFTRTKSGEKSMAFTQKVLGKGHATARLLLRNGRVYHPFSCLVYRATGRENPYTVQFCMISAYLPRSRSSSWDTRLSRLR